MQLLPGAPAQLQPQGQSASDEQAPAKLPMQAVPVWLQVCPAGHGTPSSTFATQATTLPEPELLLVALLPPPLLDARRELALLELLLLPPGPLLPDPPRLEPLAAVAWPPSCEGTGPVSRTGPPS